MRTALLMHELGDFRYSAMLAEAQGRDDRISAVLETRTQAVLGLPFDCLPSDTTSNQRKAETYAKSVKSWFFHANPEPTWAEVLRWMHRLGFCLAEIVWHQHKSGELRPRLHVHHPQFVHYSWTDRSWTLNATTGPIKVTPGDGRWVLFAPFGQAQPWMQGLVRTYSVPWLIKTFARRDWARRSEIEGIGVRKAHVPEVADEKVVDRFLRDVKALGAESTIRLPAGFDFNISAIDAEANTSFEKIIANCDMAFTIATLGQNLTTEVNTGSYAAASVHARVQLDRLEADVGTLASAIHDQIIVPWGRLNFADFDEDHAPWPRWIADPPEDLQRYGAALQTIFQALTQAKALGVDIKPVLERISLEYETKPEPVSEPVSSLDNAAA
jgi:phage gp29-like protein